MTDQQATTTTETSEQAADGGASVDIPPGQYKARGIPGSAQFGTSSTGKDQVSINLVLSDLGRMGTTILSFSDDAAPYSLDRLRLLGVPDGELSEQSIQEHCGKNEVPVLVSYQEWDGK